MTARQLLDRDMNEDELLTAILEAAMFLGWRAHHDRRSDKALQQGHPGFPDLVLIRGGRVRMYELKSAKGFISAEQHAWRHEMPPDSYAFEYRVVWPKDLDDVIESLR